MVSKTTFIGHRYILDKNIKNKLYNEIKKSIDSGCKFFTMGLHGEFDRMALNICRNLKKIYKEIKIEVVITSLNQINLYLATDYNKTNNDIDTIMYDIEEEHFKRRIISSNRQMIDSCQLLICYVDVRRNYGGAILAYKYAKKKGLQIINLF